jgi:hypothetical protein
MIKRFLLVLCAFTVCSCGGDSGAVDTGNNPIADANPPPGEVGQPDLSATDVQDVAVVPPSDVQSGDPGPAVDQNLPMDQNTPNDVVTASDVPADPGAEVSTLPDLTTLSLNGAIPQSALGPPTFNALNSDGSARDVSHLMGKPTVMWFFPFAGTPG